MKLVAEFFKRYRWALLSGVMMGTSYIPFPPWAILFCWVPLWWDILINTASPREAFVKAWWSQFVLSLIGFHWIAFVAHEFGFLPWWVAIPILIAFACIVHLYIPIAAALAVFLRDRFRLGFGSGLVLLATFHLFGEIYWPSVFPWNFGYTLVWIQAPWAQWADTIGIWGLSYFLHLGNALIAWLLFRRNPRLSLIWGTAVAAALVLTWIGGTAKQKEWRQNQNASLKALIVQANIGNLEKIYAERGAGFQREIIEKYFSMSREALQSHPDAELLIWPESAIPEFLDDHNRGRRYAVPFFQSLAELKRPVLTGAFSSDPPGPPPREDYNGIFLFGANAEVLATYHKTSLLMFGEYVPLGNIFPILRKWNPGGEGFGRGSGPLVFPFGDWKIGPQICYESLDPGFARQSTVNGADFLVNITNDSWFGPRSEPEQHLFMTLARAIEMRRPLLRSTNTGISTVIEADGTVLEQSPKASPWVGYYDVKLQKNAPLSFYARYGAALPLLLWIVVGLILGGARYGTSRLARDP